MSAQKSKNKLLTSEQKTTNKQLASERIFVEHSIAGLKRFRILSNRLRIHNFDLYDKILGVCAGLWNFNLANSLILLVKTTLINPPFY
ncbi:transposase family protein [Thiospirillum jenense]|uniref:transposase family protein n=1 Tax=Thiospirillum jenense TaxID=1653858 RepID=UPI003B831228